MNYHSFASESVCAGHPDKICDQISDAILDAALKIDPYSHSGIECLVTSNKVVIGGEVKTKAKIDYQDVARQVIKKLGYNSPIYNFDYRTVDIEVLVHQQSNDIALGVDPGGAGDQGCIKKGSLVKIDKGFLPIEEVKKGNFVVTPYGLKKVLKTKKTGIKDVIELNFINGMCLECTPEHRIFCYRRDGSFYWEKASKLTSRDFVCILKPSGLSNCSYFVSQIEKKKFFTKYNHRIFGPEKVVLDEEIGYITGLLIGDGYLVKRKLMEISFGRNKEFTLRVKKILDKKFPSQWRIIKNKNGLLSLKIDSILVRNHFENFGVLYVRSPQKTTPKIIFTSPPSVVKAYLRGLFDSDGTIVINTGRRKKNIRIRLCSSSYKLLQETQLLLTEFRIKSSILFNVPKGKAVGKDKRYRSKYDNYVLSLVGFESYQNFGREIGFFHPQKSGRMKAYLKITQKKPKNSRGIYLIPHPRKKEMIAEELINKNLPFTITILKKKTKKVKAEVYDLEIREKPIFSANGIFIHNSMFGYAVNETKELMPLPIMLAHNLVRKMDQLKEKELSYLRPDGKSQVVVSYEKGKPIGVETVILAVPHDPKIKKAQVKHDLFEKLVVPVLEQFNQKPIKEKDLIVNGTGKWEIGGPDSDMGETGRKIIVDSYGGMARVGGGCFSGKDPTKVDRSAAYGSRFLAKNIVAAKLAERCEVQVAYVIGQSQPVAKEIETFGTEKKKLSVIEKFAFNLLDLSVASILKKLELRRPMYQQTATYGHFGQPQFSWEKIIS